MSPYSFDPFQDEKRRLRVTGYHSLAQAAIDVFLLSPVGFGQLLISNPVLALQWICILLSTVQVVIWLFKPSSLDNGSSGKSADNFRKRIKTVLRSGGLLLAGAIFFHLIAVLFGAPFTENAAETFHFGVLMAMLTALPACLYLEPQPSTWSRILLGKGAENSMERHVHITTLATVFGAWVGSFPIPLDWDRPWQVWPIPCCIGALIANALGNASSGIYLLSQMQKPKKRKHV